MRGGGGAALADQARKREGVASPLRGGQWGPARARGGQQGTRNLADVSPPVTDPDSQF